MIQAVIPRPITEETWVQYLVITYDTCAVQTENAKYISPFTYILPRQCPSPVACSHLHFMLLYSEGQTKQIQETF